MKKLGLLVLMTGMTLLLFCCEEDDKPEYESVGIITGEDVRYCACCGGYFIDIEDITYRFFEIPNDKISLEVFPVFVKLNWSVDSDPCLGDEIIIEQIALTDFPD